MKTPPTLSESEILARQANEAKESAMEAMAQARLALQKQVDPRPLFRSRPIASIITAALTGFLAAIFTVPSKQESELRRLERIHRATYSPPPSAGNGDAPSNGKPVAAKQTIWTSIIHELVQLLRPIILTAITSSIKGNGPTAGPSAPAAGTQGPDKSF